MEAIEEWRDVVGYEGLYEVSSIGRVRTVERSNVVDSSEKGTSYTCIRPVKARLKKQSDNSNGYPRVSLWRNGSYKYHFVHRLVADAFVNGKRDGLVVDHVDGDRHNNRADNLRWCTQSENLNDARKRGTLKYYPMPKETRERVSREMSKPVLRSDGVRFQSALEAAKAMGCSRSLIYHAATGRKQTIRGDSFEYEQNVLPA